MNSRMMNKNIAISILNNSDIPEVIQFYNRIYKENRNEEKFKWEFFSAPAGKAIYIIAKDADTQKIIGSQCAIPIELITDKGEIILTGKSEDTLVDPDYRGLQVFEKMYALLFEKCRENGIKYLWGFTSAKKPFLKLGFSIPYDHSQSLMVIGILSAYRYLSALNSKNTFTSLSKIMGLCILAKFASYKRLIVGWKSPDKKFTSSLNDKSLLFDEHNLVPTKRYNGFWIKQDSTFLLWRIAKNPYHDKICNVYFLMKSKVVADLHFNHHKNGVWYLVNEAYSDVLTEKEKSILFNRSIELLLQKEKSAIKLIRTWDFTHNKHGRDEIKLRQKSGFVHLDRGISFVWKSLDDKETLKATDFNLSRMASQGTV